MSTYYYANGSVKAEELQAKGLTFGKLEYNTDKSSKDVVLTLEQIIGEGYGYVTDGSNWVWIDVDSNTGAIMGYKRYGANDVSMVSDLVPGVSEHAFSEDIFPQFLEGLDDDAFDRANELAFDEMIANFDQYVDTNE